MGELKAVERQIHLGIITSNVRNIFVHYACEDPKFQKGTWYLNPDLDHCVRCGTAFGARDVVNPVFQIHEVNVPNPSDPTDIGISMSDRMYLAHVDCRNKNLEKNRSNLLIIP